MLASGFTNAPVTRFLVFYVVAASFLASITDTKHYFYIHVVPHLWIYRQFWRLLTWQACYTNSTEVLFAAISFYHLRVIERLWGSRKFASFLLSTLPYTTLLPPILLALILRPLSLNQINYLPAGPTAILFAILAQYHAAIPYEYKYRLATSSASDASHPSSGLVLTSKALSYALPIQLALAQVPGSLTSAAVGWTVGYAYRNDVLPYAASWRIPGWLLGEKKAGGASEGFEGLRRRLEGEAGTASGVAGGERRGEARRRTLGAMVGEMFRGGGG